MARAKAKDEDESKAGEGAATVEPAGGAGEADGAGEEAVSFAERFGKSPEIPEKDPRGDAPARQGGGARTGAPQEVPAIRSAVLDEAHLGIVNAKGEPLDLDKVLVRDSPKARIRRATERIYEKTTMPGTDRPRMRLIVGEGGMVPDADYEALTDALAERGAATGGEAG